MNNKMDQQLRKEAFNAFVSQPELFQAAFTKIGVEFPSELLDAVKSNPERAIQLIGSDNNLSEAIISIYSTMKIKTNNGVVKAQEGTKLSLPKFQNGNNSSAKLRVRGTAPASANEKTAQSFSINDGIVKNIFSGNTLTQKLTTQGNDGNYYTTERIITNYSNPAKSDTTYKAGNTKEILAKRPLLGYNHDVFMVDPTLINRINQKLQGADPMQLNAREVKAGAYLPESDINFIGPVLKENGGRLKRK